MNPDRIISAKPADSYGNRHALETYLAVLRVRDVEPGFYRYLPLEHQLLYLYDEEQMPRKLTDATLGQTFVGRSAVVFIWTMSGPPRSMPSRPRSDEATFGAPQIKAAPAKIRQIPIFGRNFPSQSSFHVGARFCSLPALGVATTLPAV